MQRVSDEQQNMEQNSPVQSDVADEQAYPVTDLALVVPCCPKKIPVNSSKGTKEIV